MPWIASLAAPDEYSMCESFTDVYRSQKPEASYPSTRACHGRSVPYPLKLSETESREPSSLKDGDTKKRGYYIHASIRPYSHRPSVADERKKSKTPRNSSQTDRPYIRTNTSSHRSPPSQSTKLPLPHPHLFLIPLIFQHFRHPVMAIKATTHSSPRTSPLTRPSPSPSTVPYTSSPTHS